jgi:hypothetical protein
MDQISDLIEKLISGLFAGTILSIAGVTVVTLACLELPLHTLNKPKKDGNIPVWLVSWIIWGILMAPLFILRALYMISYPVGSLAVNICLMYALTLVMGSSHQAGSINMAAHAIATLIHAVRFYYWKKKHTA